MEDGRVVLEDGWIGLSFSKKEMEGEWSCIYVRHFVPKFMARWRIKMA